MTVADVGFIEDLAEDKKIRRAKVYILGF